MKIVHIIPAYKPAYIYGGPTMSVAKLCEALAKTEIEIEVFTTTANGLTELDVVPDEKVGVDGVAVTYFKRLTKDHTHFSPSLLWALRKKIKENGRKNDLIIHIHSWWNLVSIFTCWMAKYYSIPVVLTPRGMLTQYSTVNRNVSAKLLIHKWIGKRLLRYCHIHATSEKEKRDILEIVEPKSITAIYNLVRTSDASTTSNSLSQNVFNLLFLSRIEEKKGLELLFESLALLTIDWKLTIAGTGEASYVERLKLSVKNLKLDRQVSWIGHVSNDDKFEVMAKHDVLVLTSYNENFANVVVESLSVGTPVLLSDQVGLAEYVEINKLGWITSLHTDEITNKINEAYYDDHMRSKIRQSAKEIISKDFNTKNLISQYLSLYNTIL